eukprot:1447105-Amphidinium_carterae.4
MECEFDDILCQHLHRFFPGLHDEAIGAANLAAPIAAEPVCWMVPRWRVHCTSNSLCVSHGRNREAVGLAPSISDVQHPLVSEATASATTAPQVH